MNTWAILSLAAVLAAGPALADEIADFYKDRTITISSGGGAGGGYGVYALLVAKYIPKYIPGKPSVIVTYNPGGGALFILVFASTNTAY